MSTAPAPADDPRVPLGLRNGAAVFLVALAGLMLANLAPLVMAVLEDVGFDVIASGNILTWALLASALVGLGTSRPAAGRHRRTIAVVGLVIAIIGFLVDYPCQCWGHCGRHVLVHAVVLQHFWHVMS